MFLPSYSLVPLVHTSTPPHINTHHSRRVLPAKHPLTQDHKDENRNDGHTEQTGCEDEDVEFALESVHIDGLRGLDEGHVVIYGATRKAEEA